MSALERRLDPPDNSLSESEQNELFTDAESAADELFDADHGTFFDLVLAKAIERDDVLTALKAIGGNLAPDALACARYVRTLRVAMREIAIAHARAEVGL